jgi:signal transduction histidine kinase
MRFQTKLLLLTVFWALALVVNLLALGYLARTIPQALQQAERVTIRQQQVVLGMRAELRDAEAALYRYLMEGEAGFITQFDQHLGGFEQDLEVYESLVSNEEEQMWVERLKNDYQASGEIGRDLILMSDQRQEDFVRLENAHQAAQVLLAGPVHLARAEDMAYQKAVSDMRINLQEMQLAVVAYMNSPAPRESVRFTDAAVRYYQAEQRFKELAQTPQEQTWERSLEGDFSQIQGLGLRLINERDQQMSQFARFAAMLFHMGQETLEEKVQPASEHNLVLAWQQMLTSVRIVVLTSLMTGLLALIVAIAVTIPLMRQMNAGIQALLAGADRVAAGQLSEPVEAPGGHELTRLAYTFNAMMIELAARERRLKARLSELEALRQVSLQLTSTPNPDQVFQTIADSALQLANAAEVHIFMCDDAVSDLRFVASAWWDPDRRLSKRPPRPDGLVMQVARSGQAQVVDQAESHPLFSTSEAQSWGVRAAAGLPLQVGERVVGVLNVIIRDRPMLGEDELRILELLADQAAVTIESAGLYATVADREARLQALVQKLAHIQEEERRLMGLDLHDGLTQLLISANMHFNTLEAFSDHLAEPARSELTLGHARLQAAIAEARRVIAELRPAALETLGLVDGLRQYAANISQAENWQLEYATDLAEGVTIPTDIEAAIFRIAQEAVSNARKHAHTKQIRLSLRSEGSDLILEVQDWGQGFDMARLAEEKDRLGLVGMQERAALLNGAFEIESAPEAGTCIRVRVPLAFHTTGVSSQYYGVRTTLTE